MYVLCTTNSPPGRRPRVETDQNTDLSSGHLFCVAIVLVLVRACVRGNAQGSTRRSLVLLSEKALRVNSGRYHGLVSTSLANIMKRLMKASKIPAEFLLNCVALLTPTRSKSTTANSTHDTSHHKHHTESVNAPGLPPVLTHLNDEGARRISRGSAVWWRFRR